MPAPWTSLSLWQGQPRAPASFISLALSSLQHTGLDFPPMGRQAAVTWLPEHGWGTVFLWLLTQLGLQKHL